MISKWPFNTSIAMAYKYTMKTSWFHPMTQDGVYILFSAQTIIKNPKHTKRKRYLIEHYQEDFLTWTNWPCQRKFFSF